jgi:hypothetical protein
MSWVSIAAPYMVSSAPSIRSSCAEMPISPPAAARKQRLSSRRILDHRGIVVSDPVGALAHLQLGRSYALTGDTTKAKAAYQDFLTLWKDADPGIPLLKQARAEYANLQ